MPEQHNIEWKSTWKDEYLKWICGFANAQGGRIYIGMDDRGNVVGLPGYQKLLEDIPNKVQFILGIMVDVNLLESGGKYYLEINVAPSSTPINYKGEYHYRSGSTKQILKGTALNDFLLRKNGVRWDDAPAPLFTPAELDSESFELFRQGALRSGRMKEEDLNISNADLLMRLGLLTHGRLNRAAVLLFHRYPERLCRGCYVKIGLFSNGCELVYQDEVRGSLFNMADKVLDVLYLKYLKAAISYEKETRVERYPYPRSAVREIVYNALIHSKWSDGVPVQIRVDEDSMSISNCCVLPLGWSAETLTAKHKSRPYNPNIAEAFFRAGLVEAWGRGIAKVQAVCQAQGYPEPRFEVLGEDMTVTFLAAGLGSSVQASGETVQASGEIVQASGESVQASGESVQASGESVQASGKSVQASGESVQASGKSVQASAHKHERIRQEILAYCVEARSLGEISAKLGLRHLSYLRKEYIKPLLGSRLEMTHPENPRHMHQRYRTIVSDDKLNG